MKIDDYYKYFITQYDPRYPLYLRRTICGIVSFYMALDVLGIKLPDFDEFLIKYIEHGKFNIPTYALNTMLLGRQVNIPIMYTTEEASSEQKNRAKSIAEKYNKGPVNVPIVRIDNPGFEPRRAFTLEHGFDHRGVGSFIEENGWDVQSRLIEFRESDELENEIALIKTANIVGLISVSRPSHTNKHIVTALSFDLRDKVIVADPEIPIVEMAIKSIDFNNLPLTGNATLLFQD